MTAHLTHWSVEVRGNGESLVCIEHESLSGKATFTAAEEETIRVAAEHLLAFIGRRYRNTTWRQKCRKALSILFRHSVTRTR